jgi:EAL domain-containing protein (putative c-di-GMP-specific phosphodiesterase class I)
VVYQPLIDLSTQLPSGVEALARWNHPTRGMVPPCTFIPIAEEIGTIGEIGRWVLSESCRRLAGWRKRHPQLTLNVNVSPRQLEDEALPAYVEQALRDSGLDGSALTLEITDSVLVRGRGEATARLERLRAMGVSIAIDDFGIGYSSLGYLQDLPVDALKIDRLFVDAVSSGPDGSLAEAIVQARADDAAGDDRRGDRDARAARDAVPARLPDGPGVPVLEAALRPGADRILGGPAGASSRDEG